MNQPSSAANGPPPEPLPGHSILTGIRQRIIAGILLVLPVLITFWVLAWFFSILADHVVSPVARLLLTLVAGAEPPQWFVDYAAPVLALAATVVLLYFAGFLVRSRLVRWIDIVLLKLPIVTVIYKAVRKVFDALQQQEGGGKRFQRVVLVAFPHPGVRTPGFVTGSCRDAATGKTILCVFIPTTPMPTNGYMLLVPEEDVTDIDWSAEEALQAVLSLGLTTPATVQYHQLPQMQGGS